MLLYPGFKSFAMLLGIWTAPCVCRAMCLLREDPRRPRAFTPGCPEAWHKHEVRAKKARLAAVQLSIEDVPHHGHTMGTCMGHRNLRKSLPIQ